MNCVTCHNGSSFLALVTLVLLCLHFGATGCSSTDDSKSFYLVMESQGWKGTDQPSGNTATLPQYRADGSDGVIKGNLHIKEVVVHENPVGKIVLAGVLGAGVGLLGGVLLSVLLGCCILKCRHGAKLTFDRKHNTYRSADVIDGGV